VHAVPDHARCARTHAEYARALDAGVAGKLALIQEWVRVRPGGVIVDVGTGSGGVAAGLAAARRDVEIVGIDDAPLMVDHARTRHRGYRNLQFAAGNALGPGRGRQADTVLLLSLLHEVYSYGGCSHDPVARAIDRSVAQLADGGRLIVRDFVRPAGADRRVLLEHVTGDVRSGRSFADFARSSTQPVRLDSVTARARTVVYETTLGDAYEYLFRKDHGSTWTSELGERYAFWTFAEAVALVRRADLTVRHAAVIDNAWMRECRIRGRIRLRDVRDGAPMPLPLSQIFLVGEKVARRARTTHTSAFASRRRPKRHELGANSRVR